MSAYLNQFHIVKPKYSFDQATLLNWITACHQRAEANNVSGLSIDPESLAKLFQRYSVKASQISQRHFECEDIQSDTFENNSIYSISEENPYGADILKRTQFFSERALEVFQKFYDLKNLAPRPHHLIHVTCTGYASPSAAQRIVTQENWGQMTDITHAYHMGCYAAMPAVRIAQALVAFEKTKTPNFSVDIAHTEMCGLHMNPLAQTAEQMVVQTLFADGHIKYTASSQLGPTGQNLKILALLEKVIPNSEQDMSWITAPWGLQMNLSREVPAKLTKDLKAFSKELFEKAEINVNDALKSIFAVHPGGPKIIEAVQRELELSDLQLRESKKVLFERGNMSSATLPHVWSEILQNNYPIGTKVISYAFGPGLTLFGAVFEVC